MKSRYSVLTVAVPVVKNQKKILLYFKKYKLVLGCFRNQSEHNAKEKSTNESGTILNCGVGGPCDT